MKAVRSKINYQKNAVSSITNYNFTGDCSNSTNDSQLNANFFINVNLLDEYLIEKCNV